MVSKVIPEEIISRALLISKEGLSLLDYVEDVAKASIGLMNVDQQETNGNVL